MKTQCQRCPGCCDSVECRSEAHKTLRQEKAREKKAEKKARKKKSKEILTEINNLSQRSEMTPAYVEEMKTTGTPQQRKHMQDYYERQAKELQKFEEEKKAQREEKVEMNVEDELKQLKELLDGYMRTERELSDETRAVGNEAAAPRRNAAATTTATVTRRAATRAAAATGGARQKT